MPRFSLAGHISRGLSRSQLFGRTFYGTPGKSKKLALTFDDGPNHPHTTALLEVLARHDARATFFVIGRFVEQRPEIVQQIAAAGHSIGNHTQTHPFLPKLPLRKVIEELIQCEMALLTMAGLQRGVSRVVAQKDVKQVAVEEELLTNLRALRQVTGTRLFRPPWGARTRRIVNTARACGYETVMWSAMGFDWRKTTAQKVEHAIVRSVTGGDIILLHDGGYEHMGADRAHSVAATERLLLRYKDAGYEFVTVEEMLGIERNAPTGPDAPGALSLDLDLD